VLYMYNIRYARATYNIRHPAVLRDIAVRVAMAKSAWEWDLVGVGCVSQNDCNLLLALLLRITAH
jgi:hypothetical protein